ncbi:hypothetical protein EVAR_78934_1 [Eumeta japonica]|uniref:Uncharacterized protein n=1 Tax=Eumeta variegata TaxID=151549 RepID=A0A4C1U2H1_EUMVA|nr:hypothetical protein EVAR_78934_1 [Eumeta japonica]
MAHHRLPLPYDGDRRKRQSSIAIVLADGFRKHRVGCRRSRWQPYRSVSVALTKPSTFLDAIVRHFARVAMVAPPPTAINLPITSCSFHDLRPWATRDQQWPTTVTVGSSSEMPTHRETSSSRSPLEDFSSPDLVLRAVCPLPLQLIDSMNFTGCSSCPEIRCNESERRISYFLFSVSPGAYNSAHGNVLIVIITTDGVCAATRQTMGDCFDSGARVATGSVNVRKVSFVSTFVHSRRETGEALMNADFG